MQITQVQIYNKYTQTHNAQYTFYTTTSHNMCYQTFFYAGTCWFYTFRRSAACLASLSFPQTINVQHLVIHITINKICINLLTLTYKTCTLYLVEKGLLQLARATLMHAVVRFFLHVRGRNLAILRERCREFDWNQPPHEARVSARLGMVLNEKTIVA